MTTRREFFKGMGGILAASVAPAIILTPGLLMPVKKVTWRPAADWPMREVFIYDISMDEMRRRYDVLINNTQLYVECRGDGLTAYDARALLEKKVSRLGLNIQQASVLELPTGCDTARILT